MLSKFPVTSKTFGGAVLAAVMGVAVSVWHVTHRGAAQQLGPEPEFGAATAAVWTELPDIVNARFEASAVQYEGDVYAFNGFGQSIKVEPTVEKLDADTLTWSVISESSIADGSAVTHNGIVLNGNEVWLIGGRVGNHPGPVSAKVWIFNLDSRVWSAGPELPVPGAAGGAALVNDRIHWFGGLDTVAQCDVDHHFVYDLNNPSDGWRDITAIAPMPIPRNHFATVVLNGLIYAMGGQFTHDGCGPGTPDTELSHVFDPSTNIWQQIASLPAVQSHTEPSTFVYQGAIYMIGGATEGMTVFRYDPSLDQWDSVAQLPQPLLAPVARVLNNELIVSSGGAPAITPSFKTYQTDMTPLLLPSAQNPQDTDEPDSSADPDGNDSSNAEPPNSPDEGDTGFDTPNQTEPDNTTTDGDGNRCDYSNADASGGWGWDPIALVSCPPETGLNDASAQVPAEPAPETQNELPPATAQTDTDDTVNQPTATDVAGGTVDDQSGSDDQAIVVVVNSQSPTSDLPISDETRTGSRSGGGAMDRYLWLALLLGIGRRIRRS